MEFDHFGDQTPDGDDRVENAPDMHRRRATRQLLQARESAKKPTDEVNLLNA